VDTFLASSFGSFVMVLFQGLFTAPSWQSFALLAGRHIEGVACYRNGAGSARQEYRALRA
jgi:hypothetical protein